MSFEAIDGICRQTHPITKQDETAFISGRQKIAWASDRIHMPIINQLLDEYRRVQPLIGYTIVTSVHMEAKTAYLVQALAELGASVFATGCNPLSTQDDVAIALANTPNVTVYAKHGCTESEYWDFLASALSHHPHIIIDDGGDLVELLRERCREFSDRILGGCEETTTGIHRLRALAKKELLDFPMINVNDAECKHNYDNHYGTGQSVLDGFIRSTNLIIAGKTVVVAGYGDCGSGIAKRFKGLGAKIIVTEINPIKALKANMDGFTVMTMNEASKLGDIFITATGCKDVITEKHFKTMKDGTILANAGHFNVEIDVESLAKLATTHFEARRSIESYQFANGKHLHVLADGRLVNLAAADGHPAEIMDMSFSIQLLSVLHIAKYFNQRTAIKLYSVPDYIDKIVASLALKSQNINIDTLTQSQQEYLENGV